jgi:hypothetical protein
MAERTFLDHSDLSFGNIGIQKILDFPGPSWTEIVEIFESIRTIVRAITTTDTACVDLGDNSLRILIGRSYRTNLDTGRIFTVHTRPGKISLFDIRILSLHNSEDRHPGYGPESLFLDWIRIHHIVFRLAGNHARLASRTSI